MKVNNCCFNLNTNLKKACWELTSNCNLNCNHCFVKRSDQSSVSYNPNFTDDLNTLMRIHKLGIKHLILSGGEPLLYPNLLPLFSILKSLGIRATIATNGTLLSQEISEKLSQAGLSRATISLDGYDSQTNKILRGTDWAFSKSLRGASYLVKSGIIVTINVVLHTAIVNNLKKFIRPLQKCEVQKINFTFPVCRSSGESSVVTPVGDKEEIFREIADLEDIFDDIEIQINDPKCDLIDCPAGKDVIGINSRGEIVDCLVKNWKYDCIHPQSENSMNGSLANKDPFMTYKDIITVPLLNSPQNKIYYK